MFRLLQTKFYFWNKYYKFFENDLQTEKKIHFFYRFKISGLLDFFPLFCLGSVNELPHSV